MLGSHSEGDVVLSADDLPSLGHCALVYRGSWQALVLVSEVVESHSDDDVDFTVDGLEVACWSLWLTRMNFRSILLIFSQHP